MFGRTIFGYNPNAWWLNADYQYHNARMQERQMAEQHVYVTDKNNNVIEIEPQRISAANYDLDSVPRQIASKPMAKPNEIIIIDDDIDDNNNQIQTITGPIVVNNKDEDEDDLFLNSLLKSGLDKPAPQIITQPIYNGDDEEDEEEFKELYEPIFTKRPTQIRNYDPSKPTLFKSLLDEIKSPIFTDIPVISTNKDNVSNDEDSTNADEDNDENTEEDNDEDSTDTDEDNDVSFDKIISTTQYKAFQLPNNKVYTLNKELSQIEISNEYKYKAQTIDKYIVHNGVSLKITYKSLHNLLNDFQLSSYIIVGIAECLKHIFTNNYYTPNEFMHILNVDDDKTFNEQLKLKSNWFEFDNIFIIYNYGGNHWVLLQITDKLKNMFIYDPLYDSNIHSDTLERLKRFIQELLHKQGEDYEINVIPVDNIPKQNTAVDCGVFVILYLLCLSYNINMNFAQEDITTFRIKIAYSVIYGTINNLIDETDKLAQKSAAQYHLDLTETKDLNKSQKRKKEKPIMEINSSISQNNIIEGKRPRNPTQFLSATDDFNRDIKENALTFDEIKNRLDNKEQLKKQGQEIMKDYYQDGESVVESYNSYSVDNEIKIKVANNYLRDYGKRMDEQYELIFDENIFNDNNDQSHAEVIFINLHDGEESMEIFNPVGYDNYHKILNPRSNPMYDMQMEIISYWFKSMCPDNKKNTAQIKKYQDKKQTTEHLCSYWAAWFADKKFDNEITFEQIEDAKTDKGSVINTTYLKNWCLKEFFPHMDDKMIKCNTVYGKKFSANRLLQIKTPLYDFEILKLLHNKVVDENKEMQDKGIDGHVYYNLYERIVDYNIRPSILIEILNTMYNKFPNGVKDFSLFYITYPTKDIEEDDEDDEDYNDKRSKRNKY